MSVNEISFSFEAVRWLLMAAIAIYSWLVGRQAASAKEMLELRTRIVALETQMQQMPSSTQISDLTARLERVDARLEGVVDSMQPISRSLERVNDYLLNHK